MSEGLSKFIIAIEALLLLVPTSALVFWIWASGVMLREGALPLNWWVLFVLFPTICLVCGWILVFRFFLYGWVALRATSRWIWFGATLGGLATIAALAISLGAVRLRVVLPEYFGLLVAGSPALIPLTHLALERIFSKPANPQLERSQVGVVTRR